MTENAEQPAALPPGFKWMPCRYCGKPIKTLARRQRKPSHIECGIQAMRDHNAQMMSKSGPAYERWLSSMARSVERATREGTPRDDGPPSRKGLM